MCSSACRSAVVSDMTPWGDSAKTEILRFALRLRPSFWLLHRNPVSTQSKLSSFWTTMETDSCQRSVSPWPQRVDFCFSWTIQWTSSVVLVLQGCVYSMCPCNINPRTCLCSSTTTRSCTRPWRSRRTLREMFSTRRTRQTVSYSTPSSVLCPDVCLSVLVDDFSSCDLWLCIKTNGLQYGGREPGVVRRYSSGCWDSVGPERVKTWTVVPSIQGHL